MTKIAVLVSGGGTNLQALIDAQQAGKIENGQISLVISSNPKAYALERAAKAAIPSEVLRRRDFSDAEEYGKALTAGERRHRSDRARRLYDRPAGQLLPPF